VPLIVQNPAQSIVSDGCFFADQPGHNLSLEFQGIPDTFLGLLLGFCSFLRKKAVIDVAFADYVNDLAVRSPW